MRAASSAPLALPLSELGPRYDAVVIGSGYGGAIAASRLSRARRPDGSHLSVCVLERGRELRPGDFPRSLASAARELQVDSTQGSHGRDDGLFWLHKGRGISVLRGCGLGGGSLINAGVALEPDPEVFCDPRWPAALRADGSLRAGFDQARAMLRPTPYPAGAGPLPKDEALRQAARGLGDGARCEAAPINVSFEAGTNQHGVEQAACTGCGECVAGCNVGAKNTLTTNYLPDARSHGAQIFCRIGVRRIEEDPSGEPQAAAGYRVFYQPLDCGREAFRGHDMFVRARIVVLAAGVLGSCEVLGRSRAAGRASSSRLGQGRSGNGDSFGFAHRTTEAVHGVRLGADTASPDLGRPAPGPCISALIDRRAGARGHVIQGGVIPRPLALPLSALLERVTAQQEAGTAPRSRGMVAALRGALRGGDGLGHTQSLLVMSHDAASGRARFDGERCELSWAGPGHASSIAGEGAKRADAAAREADLARATAALGGRYVSAQETPLGDEHRLTVHPLGGCSMGEDGARGVTNHQGQLFRGEGAQVHHGLYVMDGSVIPRSLGVNPHLTIAALAERNVRRLLADRGLRLDDSQPPRRPARTSPPPAAPLHVRFTERIVGDCALVDPEAPSPAPCELVLTVMTHDCAAMDADPVHAARIVGSCHMPALSASAMTISEGRFNLFIDSERKSLKRMRYRMALQSAEGPVYFLDGHKRLDGQLGHGLWRDTTRLHVTLRREHEQGEELARGTLRITAGAFLEELLHMRAEGGQGQPSPRALALYTKMFGLGLWDIYRPRLPATRLLRLGLARPAEAREARR